MSLEKEIVVDNLKLVDIKKLVDFSRWYLKVRSRVTYVHFAIFRIRHEPTSLIYIRSPDSLSKPNHSLERRYS